MKPMLQGKLHLMDWRDDLAVVTHGYPLSQQILRTDVSGMPLEWVDYREAARLYHTEQVAYTCGTLLYRLYGGTCARTGLRTIVDVNSIIATLGTSGNPGNLRGSAYTPPLNNLTPFSRGGHDTWSNVVSACRRCNNAKASRTPEQAGMQLLAVPFTPTYAEYIFLKGRRVLADQMEYLIAHFPRSSPLHERMQRWPM